MSGHTPQHRIGALARFRVTFAKELLGLRFPIASVEVRHARDADRALRVAELKFSPRCCTDPAGGARGRAEVAGRLLS
jgi:hypothetical protein